MTVKVAAIGIGEHARRNTLPALFSSEAIELVGLCSRNSEVLQREAERYHCKAYNNPDEMLADPQIDAVYVALPIGLHAAWGQKILQANKHLWCEKTLTHDPVASQELVRMARQNDLAVCECFMYTHHPQFSRLMTIMGGEEIGVVRNITARFGFPHLDPENIRYNRALGGGALLDAGCYLLHAARLLSSAMPEEVHAIITHDDSLDIDTGGSALLGFPSGLHAQLEWGFGCAYVNEIELWGERGRARARRAFSKPADHEPSIEIMLNDHQDRSETSPCYNHFVGMFEHFSVACTDPGLRETLRNDAEQQAILLQRVLKHNRHSG